MNYHNTRKTFHSVIQNRCIHSYCLTSVSSRHRTTMMKSKLSRVSIILFSILAVLSAAESTVNHYCPYFKNRAPSPQSNLENCKWFRDNACCLNHELRDIFSAITTPLKAASEECSKHTSYLMCYVCAPNQETFYEDERLTVCEEFCDRWYTSCQNAIWKGFIVKDLYNSSAEFCKARKFLVASKGDKLRGCYSLTVDENSASFLNMNKLVWIVVLTVAIWTGAC